MKPEYFSTEYLEACDREDARQIESAADTIVHELANVLPEEINSTSTKHEKRYTTRGNQLNTNKT
mgnify:CR=1 FL=1|tara:strand:- start:4829 stop:5023 length:195 start_codon:yes stop_codon:yes gene_type:complete